MTRRIWLVFSVVQGLGEACFWLAPHILAPPGPVLWVTGFVLLLPGKVVSMFIAEKLLWGSPLTLRQMNVIQVPIEILFNLLVWLACAKLLGPWRSRHARGAIQL